MDGRSDAAQPRVVYIEAPPLSDRHLTGIGRYTARLALALGSRARVRFFAGDREVQAPEALDWSQDQDLRRWARRVWRGRRVPLGGTQAGSLAVYGCMRPTGRRFPTEISVLHDFTPLVLPQSHTATTLEQFRYFFSEGLLHSDWAVSVSHATKADASWLCDFPQERIVVCHSGPSQCVGRHLDPRPVTRRANVGLVVATLEPRKNAGMLFDWFRDSTALPDGIELWWVGRIGWLTTRRQLRAYRAVKGRRIRFLGPVSDARLCRLYRTAGFSIYPSLYEGFGFPVLDALRHGTPVLTGYHSALREFEGLQGITYFDPCDPATLDEAWRQFAAGRPDVAPIEELDRRYSWDHVARTLLNLPRDDAGRVEPPASRAA
jgi:glycosyltransferase involved in cell wall biosynthesis